MVSPFRLRHRFVIAAALLILPLIEITNDTFSERVPISLY